MMARSCASGARGANNSLEDSYVAVVDLSRCDIVYDVHDAEKAETFWSRSIAAPWRGIVATS